LFWVIGPEQELALKQMFAVCEQLGIGKVSDYTHLPYGYVSVKGKGKMSSREGNVLFIDDVVDQTKSRVLERTQDGEVPQADREKVAEQVALAAVKYTMLRSGPRQDIAFDIESATDPEGDSGPYLQYTYVRTHSVLEKAKNTGLKPNTKKASPEASDAERLLYRFPEVVERAAKDYAPQYVVTYLTELAGSFNTFYAKEKIVDQDDEYSPYKLALAQAVGVVLKNGLWLLGIQAPERM